MKNKVITVFIIAISMILLTTVTFAASGTVELKTDANQVKKGDTFTVTLSATSEDGINGIDTKYTYDSEKLEVVSENLVDSTKWSNLGSSPDITIICNSTQSIKKADIYTIKFKVKDNVSAGDTIKIETTSILLDTDAQTNSELTIPAKKIEITVIENQKENSDESQKQDSSKGSDEGSKQEGAQSSNGNSKENGTNSKEQDTKETQSTTQSTIPTSNNQKSSDTTTAKSVLPKTGENFLIIATIFILIILAIIFYKKYMQNKDIN